MRANRLSCNSRVAACLSTAAQSPPKRLKSAQKANTRPLEDNHVRGRVAPFVLDGPINRNAFETYIAKVLIPELRPGDVVIRDNLSSHKGPNVRAMIEAAGSSLPTCRAMGLEIGRFCDECNRDLLCNARSYRIPGNYARLCTRRLRSLDQRTQQQFTTATFLERFGAASYSLYLVHNIMIAELPPFYALACVALATSLFHLAVERPSHEFARYLANLRGIRGRQSYDVP